MLLLDNCLCHEVFRKEMGELLRTKIGGPPIGKFVKSVVKYVKNCR